jgi:hypothetical protein
MQNMDLTLTAMTVTKLKILVDTQALVVLMKYSPEDPKVNEIFVYFN